ncbi:MAG: endonuclease/exonuclease/phosphatase family protein [Luteolibacter sp.]
MIRSSIFLTTVSLLTSTMFAQDTKTSGGTPPVVRFDFEGNLKSSSSPDLALSGSAAYSKGLVGQSLRLLPDQAQEVLTLDSQGLPFRKDKDFTVQLWVKTAMDAKKTAVILSQKDFPDDSLASQKNPGWVLYYHDGTWAWNMGSGKRRITQECDNGTRMPLNDGKWHQLTMVYTSGIEQVHLYYDGDRKALYSLGDAAGFDFANTRPLTVGWKDTGKDSRAEIQNGAEKLQALVDAFQNLNVGKVEPGDLLDLICEPKQLAAEKLKKAGAKKDAAVPDLTAVLKAKSDLMRNPYTVHQIKEFTEIAPVAKIYALVDGKIVIKPEGEKAFLEAEKLSRPDLELDNMAVWDRSLTPDEVAASYAEHATWKAPELKQSVAKLTVADWNIWHGGKHFTVAKDGWDSRVRIAEMLKKVDADVVMMQETYSSGDFIAAELGYHFATTVDGDYLNQGSNISVLSRYPIKELYVPKNASFMNVAVKVAVSKTQDIYVMSNWYGMTSFPAVFDFHQARFAESDTTPVLFAGDFNAVPHTDGGKSPASEKMLASGFIDAFRSLYPDIAKYPGHSHREGVRIDQIYYKGKSLTNTSTKIISTWPSGFPSDHFMLLSTFDLHPAK